MKSTPILAASGAAGRLAVFVFVILLVAMSPSRAPAAPEFDFHAPASVDDPSLGATMRDLETPESYLGAAESLRKRLLSPEKRPPAKKRNT